jgi:hypothetical protein
VFSVPAANRILTAASATPVERDHERLLQALADGHDRADDEPDPEGDQDPRPRIGDERSHVAAEAARRAQ